MAQLRDLIVQGVTRIIGKLVTTETQIQKLDAPLSDGSSSFGSGTSGQVLKTNGSSIYWGNVVDISNTPTSGHIAVFDGNGKNIKDSNYTTNSFLTSQNTAHIYGGTVSDTSNAAVETNGSAYLILKDGSTYTRLKVSGSGGTIVTTDASGYFTITSPSLGTTSTTAASGNHTHNVTLTSSSTYLITGKGSVTNGSATTPASIDTNKFSGGSFSRGAFTGGSLTFATDATDSRLLKITFTAATHSNDTFTAATINDGFYTAGTKGTPTSVTWPTFSTSTTKVLTNVSVKSNGS